MNTIKLQINIYIDIYHARTINNPILNHEVLCLIINIRAVIARSTAHCMMKQLMIQFSTYCNIFFNRQHGSISSNFYVFSARVLSRGIDFFAADFLCHKLKWSSDVITQYCRNRIFKYVLIGVRMVAIILSLTIFICFKLYSPSVSECT